jgi:hypothetical protein
LGAPNVKITLCHESEDERSKSHDKAKSESSSGDDGQSDESNSSKSRVCMSENACLNIINKYAGEHSGNLVKGAATSKSSNHDTYTDIFPGSRGTCHDAESMSDDDVEGMLERMTHE